MPLAYVMTVFSDPRNIELTLATIFRPHNSYCLHIDPKSDHIFRYDKKGVPPKMPPLYMAVNTQDNFSSNFLRFTMQTVFLGGDAF